MNDSAGMPVSKVPMWTSLVTANAGDMGLIPGPGRSQLMAEEQLSLQPQLLSLCPEASEPRILNPRTATAEAQAAAAHGLQLEKPPQRGAPRTAG